MAANRERRSNAGNRLQALLNQEEDMEELFDDEGEDEEFDVVGKEEEDIVDSDFDQSSADDENGDDEDEENVNEDPEEAKEKKKKQAMMNHLKTGKSSMSVPGSMASLTTRPKSSRQSAAAAATFISKSTSERTKKSGLSSSSQAGLGISSTSNSMATTTEDGESSSKSAAESSRATSRIKIPMEVRKSSRRTTVLNNQETELKLLEYETRKALLPKREKVLVRKMTQEELLEEAKKTEELNLKSLQAFKAMEMEKKKVVKKKEVVMDTFVRYHSFGEWIGRGPLIQALAEVGVPTPGTTRPPTRAGSPSLESGGAKGSQTPGASAANHAHQLAQNLAQSLQNGDVAMKSKSKSASRRETPRGSPGPSASIGGSADLSLVNTVLQAAMNTDGSTTPTVSASSSVTPTRPSSSATPTVTMSAGSIARKRKRLHPHQICGRNWITFVGYDDESSPVNEWSYTENYPEKNQICPITGLRAKYKDPKTGVPYANKEAFKILQKVVQHGYVWSNGLNAYVHDVAQVLPRGVPVGMAEILVRGPDGDGMKDGDMLSAAIAGGGGGGYTYRRRPVVPPHQYQYQYQHPSTIMSMERNMGMDLDAP